MRDANRYEHEVTCMARNENASTCSDTRARSAKWHVWALYVLIKMHCRTSGHAGVAAQAAQGPQVTDDAKHPEFPEEKMLRFRKR